MSLPAFERRSLREVLLGGACLDLGSDHRDAVFLFGSARSGTTWLARLLAERLRARYVFEPFHPGRVDTFRNGPAGRYLRPDEPRPELRGTVSDVLSGRLRSRWSDRHGARLVARRRVVKEVRANLMVGWLLKNFPGMPVVLLLRHPGAVVASRLALGWPDRLEPLVRQPDLARDYLAPFREVVEETLRGGDPVERALLAWCIENYVALRQIRAAETRQPESPALIVRYEDLLIDPDRSLRDLLDRLNPAGTLDRTAVPARELPPAARNVRRLSGWRERLPKRYSRRAGELLATFGLDGLYGEAVGLSGSGAGPALSSRGSR